jgi:nucleoid DNA-binding protein
MMTKQEIINRILEDIQANHYDSKDLVMRLVKEALERRTKAELLRFWQLEGD